MKSLFFKLIICFLFYLLSFSKSFAQCPTVDNDAQVLCNLESLFVSDLEATDNGGGIAWFDTATSTSPLDPNLSLVNGENYFADNAAGDCGSRQEVILTVLGPPVGANFQGVCVENAIEATIADLNVTGNDVQWYLSESGGTALAMDTILNDETIYHADQSNPTTNCRTSRLAVLVNVGIVPVPEGEAFQQFCATSDNIPIVSDLNATGINNWYLSESSASPLDLNTPLISGNTYFANSIDPPCESDSRLMVTVEIIVQNSAGTNGNLDICEGDTATYDLFDSLNGSPDIGGTWSPELNSGTGIFDPTIDTITTYTYTVLSTNVLCNDLSASVSVSIAAIPNAGIDGSVAICDNEINTFNLFDSLNGSPDSGGTWSPELNSGTGVFDPTIDSEGIYTYTVISNNPICGSASAQISVSFATSPNAGNNGVLQLCEDDTMTYDLFDRLNDSPDTGGTWSPALNSGTGLFDPTVDNEGTYTYTVFSTNTLCENATATVNVSITANPNAGSDGVLEICENETNTFDLFDSLNGAPDTNGTWSPALTSGTGLFDPALDNEGFYTYIVISNDGICGRVSAQVAVSFSPSPDAGNDGALQLCENDTTIYDLFDSLNGLPDSGGIWSPSLNSGTGVFDPAIDSEGVYTYTVPSANPQCENDSAAVTVSSISTPSAGSNGSLEICESDTNTFNLFNSLNGTPDTGGTWSPALTSGTGLFDPTSDSEGIYTYTVESTNPICDSASAQVAVSLVLSPNAGNDGALQICENDTTNYNLFDSLNGVPDNGGVWSPSLNSGTGVFDPTIDSEGVYTYTVSSTNDICEDATATVTITSIPSPDAGADGTIEICESDTNTFDLFNSLNGTPDTGGIWSPALTSGTGVFDPTSDNDGVYTYTVESTNSICGSASAQITVSFVVSPNAGNDGALQICENDTTNYDLFDSLNGVPDNGGVWSPSLNSGTGLFDPTIDSEGLYTYTVSSTNDICEDATATVNVTIAPSPDAGTDGSIDICESDTNTFDLFDSLNGTPDAGGIWSPALTSGTGVFDPTSDNDGVYTYTVESIDCEQIDTAEVLIITLDEPNLEGLSIAVPDSCQGIDLIVTISNAFQLLDGDYSIIFGISGANTINQNIILTILNGEGNFTLNSELFINSGEHQLTINNISSVPGNCNGDVSNLPVIDFIILDSITPILIEEGNSFCASEAPTIESLTNNITNADGFTVEWYDTPEGGIVYDSDTPLTDGITYYASIISNDGCDSSMRLEVTAIIIDCIEDLIIPDGFSPNNDGINDTFNIRNIDVLYPNFKLTIYNRYGNKLYEGDIDSPQWNGTSSSGRSFGDAQLPVGVYVFIIEFNDGIRKELQGRVYLNR